MSRTSVIHRASRHDGFLLAQRHRGACSEETAGLFFDDGNAGRGARKLQDRAKAICRVCPILHACRAYARADRTLEGIWGGETHDERRAAPRTPPSGPPPAENQEGRRLAATAAQLASRQGLTVAARTLKIPPATLRRVLALYSLDEPAPPTSSLPPVRGGDSPSPAASPPTTTTTRTSGRGRRSRPSSPSRAGH